MPNIKLNDPYVNFKLPSTSEESYSLDRPSLGEIKVVIFSCNHCPYAQAWEDRIINIQEKFSKDNVSIIMISSNDASKYPEDNFEKMQERHRDKKFNFDNGKYITYGLGKSYGDVCLNENENLIINNKLNKIIHFDKEEGVIDCESGVSFEEILDLIVKDGWFLPVVAGTRYITVGGAIANDIHGKNHHKNGSFGNFIENFKLLRSDNKILD